MKKPMKAALLHFGTNMWRENDGNPLHMDYDVWKMTTDKMAELGYNAVLIDMGEAVIYDNYPELAIEGSWTKAEFKKELDRLRKIGLTPYPKLNFSTGHDAWLKEYSYMVGTKKYYEVCKGTIEEIIDLFDTPEFIHLGMDEECHIMQINYHVSVARTHKKRLEDMNYLFDVVRAKGVRPWIWLDPTAIPEMGGAEFFFQNIAKDVLLSNWYYHDIRRKQLETTEYVYDFIKFFNLLDEWGYEQVPTTSIWGYHLNSKDVLRYCENTIENDMVGYMIAPWLHCVKGEEYALLTNLYNFDKAWKDEVKK